MKKISKTVALVVLSIFILSLVGCGKSGSDSGDTEWKYKKAISSPIKATSSKEAVTMGKLDKEKVEIQIPGKTFDKSTAVTVVNPDEVPNVVGSEITPLGAPIEIKAGDQAGVRLNEPVTITMKIDKSAIKSKDPGQVWVAYYNGEKWDYIKPAKVDLTAGTLQFTSYHFSLFGYGEISVDERLKKWTQNEALTQWAHESVNSKFDEAAEKVIDHILTDKLGIEEDSMKAKVLGSLLKDGEWGDIRKNIQDAYENGTSIDQVADLNEKINMLACKKIVDIVPDSKLKSALGGITDDFGAGTVKAASQAAGALAAGNKLEAVRIMGEHLSDQFIATTAIKIAASAVQLQIDSWRNAEVEAAYQVYKNGASSKVPFWGYNVQAGEFDDVWEQMKGVSRQLCIEAIKAQEEVRREAGYPPLTDKEKDNIRELVKKDLKKQFEQRKKDDEEVAEQQAKLKELVDKYKESKMLEEGMFGYDKGYTMEQRLDLLMHLKDKILKDTGRKGLTDGAFSTKANVSYADLVGLSQAWYTQPDGWQKYAQMVKDKFGIDLFPKPEELNGQWSGSFTITELNLPASDKGSAGTGGSSGDAALQGCEGIGPEVLKALVNTPLPTTYNLKMDKAGNGTMTMVIQNNGQPSQPTVFQCSYNTGKVTATTRQQDASMNLEAKVSQDKQCWILNGTGSATGGGMTMKAKWTCSKVITPVPTETKPGTTAKKTTQKK